MSGFLVHDLHETDDPVGWGHMRATPEDPLHRLSYDLPDPKKRQKYSGSHPMPMRRGTDHSLIPEKRGMIWK